MGVPLDVLWRRLENSLTFSDRSGKDYFDWNSRTIVRWHRWAERRFGLEELAYLFNVSLNERGDNDF